MNLSVMNSDGEYEPLETQQDFKEDLDSNLSSLNEEEKQYLAKKLEQVVSLSKSVGRKEAELRGTSKMKQIMLAAAASGVFSFVAAALVAMQAFGVI